MVACPQFETLLTEAQFRQQVGWLLGRNLGRTRCWMLRSELGLVGDSLTYNDARALAYYAKLRRSRVSPGEAKRRTIHYCEENHL